MRKIIAALGMSLLGMSAMAGTPVIDGNIETATYGATLATQSEPSSFGASMYVEGIYVTDDTNNVYIAVEGDSSFNNHILLAFDISNVTGDSAAPVPATGGGGGALNGGGFVGSTLELPQLDFGLTINSGDNNAAGAASSFLDGVDYTGGTNTATYLGSDAVSGTVSDTSRTTASWTTTFGTGVITFAYSDNDSAGTGVGTIEGVEYSIPKAILGVNASSQIRLFAALTGGSGYFSSSVLPPVTGRGAVDIGNTPNFTTLAGTQVTAPAFVPVELSGFEIM